MKKIILGLICVLSIGVAQAKTTYSDLYGEIQMNIVVADTCLKEISITRTVTGEGCRKFEKELSKSIAVYSRILNIKYESIDTAGTFWTQFDWDILKNQMKKLIYVSELIKQFK
jgi:hypothetical protein